jgi:hypothetical protein
VRADGEEHVHLFAGVAVECRRLRRAQRLPGLDRLSLKGIDGFGERGAGLVGGHLQQADGVLGEHVG